MKPFQPDKYEIILRKIGPDSREHYVVCNNETDECALLYNKKEIDDASFYAPHLMTSIGNKIGIKVPKTEVGYMLHKDIDKTSYSATFFESTLVYIEDTMKMAFLYTNLAFVHQDVIQSIYYEENPEIGKSRDIDIYNGIDIDDYINSYIHFLTTRGEENPGEVRQEIIDRIIFDLKLGIKGINNIKLRNNKNAELQPHYLSSGMLGLNLRKEWINQELEKEEQEFTKDIENEFKPQFKLSGKRERASTSEILKYLLEKYPEQTRKAHKKVEKFKEEDLKRELENCEGIEEFHKEFALKVFSSRNKEFEEIIERTIEEER